MEEQATTAVTVPATVEEIKVLEPTPLRQRATALLQTEPSNLIDKLLQRTRTNTFKQLDGSDLFSLYEPLSLGRDIYDVDIVAVHGYGEDATSAWTFETPKAAESTRIEVLTDQMPGRDALKRTTSASSISKLQKMGLPKQQSPTNGSLAVPTSTTEKNKTPAEKSQHLSVPGGGSLLTEEPLPLPGMSIQSPDNKVQWLIDSELLPGDLKNARILRFEYRKPLEDSSIQPPLLFTIGQELRTRLAILRQNCSNRPVIFIGHDFGVTVIEWTLYGSQNDSLPHATAGIIFLASFPETSYFVPGDHRVSPGISKIPYSEVRDNANFCSQHLEEFKKFSDSVADKRPAIAHHCLQGSGKISSRIDPTYLSILKIITDILTVYPLLDCAVTGNDSKLDLLLSLHLSPDLQDSAGQAALHLAVRGGHNQCIRKLLSKKASVNLQNRAGYTALHYAVICHKGSTDLFEILVASGANANIRNGIGESVLDLGEKYGIPAAFLTHHGLIRGPSENPIDPERDPEPPTSRFAARACRSISATLAEFYLEKQRELFVNPRPSVHELLYERGRGPEEILAAVRPSNMENHTCRWYHLPANNITWVDDLFAKIKVTKDSLVEDQHDGTTKWSFYMRPQARSFKPRKYNKHEEGKWQTEDVPGKHLVLFMPFLNFERRCDQHEISEVVSKDPNKPSFSLVIQEVIRGEIERLEKMSTLEARPQLVVTSESGDTSSLQDGALTTKPKAKSSDIHSIAAKKKPLDTEKDLILGYAQVEGKPLHIRRSLDQSHYFMLTSTTERDGDQVALKLRRKERKNRWILPSVKEVYPMVMVDQLWLWVIGDTVISCFPQKWMQPDWQRKCDVLDRLLDTLYNNKERPPITCAQDLANLILTHCVNVFNDSRSPSELHLQDDYERSVGTVAAEEMRLFRKFKKESKDDPSEIFEKEKGKKKHLNDLFDIRDEIKQLDDTKDIRDEITMILKVLDAQALVVADMASILQPDNHNADAIFPRSPPRKHRPAKASTKTHPGQPRDVVSGFSTSDWEGPTRTDLVATTYNQRHPVIDANIRDFERMLDHTNASYKALNDLLDLKQKQTNAAEARIARLTAEDTARQGNTIMFFTIVTIIFGSLSFVSAFFALNVTQFPKLDGTTTWQLGHIVGYVIGISFGLSLPFVIMAFSINPILDWTEWQQSKRQNTLAFFKRRFKFLKLGRRSSKDPADERKKKQARSAA